MNTERLNKHMKYNITSLIVAMSLIHITISETCRAESLSTHIYVTHEETLWENKAAYTQKNIPTPTQKVSRLALKTNMLYNAALVPNIGAEIHIGRRWSVGGSWMYAWWKNNKRHNYWRIYGIELNVRKYFGNQAAEKTFTGHHLGLNGQALTYDFETGGRGYMAGSPGGTIFDKANYTIGLEYGYALPIGRKLNLDFSLGVGYMGGEYHEYLPLDECNVWQNTKKRHWLGPVKAEISLMWLIGCSNYRRKKTNNKK